MSWKIAKLTPMVHRKTEPTDPGSATVVISKIDTYGVGEPNPYDKLDN